MKYKLKCVAIDSTLGTVVCKNVRLEATDSVPTDEFQWNPSDSIQISCVSGEIHKLFEVNKDYYIDISPS